jgi:AraC-like DNA-binding protein
MHETSLQFEHPGESAEFRRAASHPGVELYRAHIVRHAFQPHAHDAFGLGAIESGVERFRYLGAEHLAPPDSLVLMNPGELHTGRAESEEGWRYRMIYVDPAVVEDVTGERGWWFDEVVRSDAPCARRVTSLFNGLWQASEPMDFDSRLFSLLAELRKYARMPRAATTHKLRFDAVVDYLHVHLSRRIALGELAAVAGLSPFHFLRCFHKQYHVTPQQMLMALRLLEAKRLLACGETPSQVAAATGLTDQAHLTHAFAQRYGVTPARYQRQVRS